MSEMLAAYHQLRGLGEFGCVAHALDGIAAVLVADARLPAAAELLGAAERLRETTGAAQRPWEIDAHERTVRALEEGLSPAELRERMVVGASVGLDEIIARAEIGAEAASSSSTSTTD
jgi:hypothetical protein